MVSPCTPSSTFSGAHFITCSHGFFMERPSHALMGAFLLAQHVASIIASFADCGFTYIQKTLAAWIGVIWVWVSLLFVYTPCCDVWHHLVLSSWLDQVHNESYYDLVPPQPSQWGHSSGYLYLGWDRHTNNADPIAALYLSMNHCTWTRCCSSAAVYAILALLRTESATSRIQRIPSPSSPKAAPKLKYSYVVESTLWPYDPGKLSPDLSRIQSCDISTTLGSRDVQAHDPGKVSHDLPRDWSSTQSQVITQSPDQAHFRCTPSLLIGTWKTVGTINKSTNQQTSHKTLKCSKVAHPLPVFVPALKYGPPIWVCMPALNMYAQTTLY